MAKIKVEMSEDFAIQLRLLLDSVLDFTKETKLIDFSNVKEQLTKQLSR